jgi:carbohydrate diacid regulator
MLTPALAQEIATDISALIGHNVLITDRDAIVIGSGDTARVGSFHEASVEVIRSLRLATHAAPQARDLHGVKPGITLPLVFDGAAVGTVGITGSPREVKRFGLVVRRQTEILLQEAAMVQTRLLREQVVQDLVRDIASYDPEVVDDDFLVSRAGELGFDLRVRRIAVALELVAPEPASDPELRPSAVRADALRTVRRAFDDRQDIVSTTGSGRAAVLHRLPSSTGDDVRLRVETLLKTLHTEYGVSVRAGIGSAANSLTTLRLSYQDALDALRLGVRLHAGVSVHVIDYLRLHQTLASVGHRTRARLVDVTLSAARKQSDWPVLRKTFTTWCENGFNLVQTAAALHVHRNTLIYRLRKLEQLGNAAVEDRQRCLTMYLACLADALNDVGIGDPLDSSAGLATAR